MCKREEFTNCLKSYRQVFKPYSHHTSESHNSEIYCHNYTVSNSESSYHICYSMCKCKT